MRPLFLITITSLLLITGCGPKKPANLAQKAAAQGNWDEAYRLWTEILQSEPNNTSAQIGQERARINASLYHLQRAAAYFEGKRYDEAAFELTLTIALDPHNQEAIRLIDRVKIARAEEERKAQGITQRTESTLPKLRPTTWEPQDLMFVDQPVKDIYQSLGQAYGVNIVIDSKLRNDKITLDLRRLNFLKALDTLMVINRHFFKVIDDNTIIILDDSKQNRDRYDNQIIQTFYLSNITPADLKNHLRVLLNIKEFAENEKLNAITIKGTPEQIALAEKMISTNDKAQAEVAVQIEILEVNKSNMRKVGLLPVSPIDGSPAYQVGVIADPAGRSDDDRDASGIRGLFPGLDSEDLLTVVPAVAIDFLKDSGGAKQVAKPQMRVTSGESGLVRIGQSIPIVQTSFTNAQLSGSASGGASNRFGDQALTTFNYNDVGIRIEVTPRVHFNNEITLTLDMEISSVVSAGLQPILGKRQVTTSLRLRNGETNVLAGLLTEEERKSLTGIIGLADIPIIGKLFSNDEKIVNQTDIIMTIRPVIVRGPDIRDDDRAPYELGNLTLSTLYGEAMEQETAPANPRQNQTPSTSQPQGVIRQGGAATQPQRRQNRKAFDPNPTFKNPNTPDTSDDPFADDPFNEEIPIDEEAPPALLSFMPISQEGRQDDTLAFQMFITNVENLKQSTIVVDFDPDVLQVESVELGDFFQSKKPPMLTHDFNNKKGRVAMITTHRASAQPFSGAGIIGIMRFRAKNPGEGSLVFHEIKLKNAEGEEIQTEGLTASYKIYP